MSSIVYTHLMPVVITSEHGEIRQEEAEQVRKQTDLCSVAEDVSPLGNEVEVVEMSNRIDAV